jgi:hypothetical protein
MLAAAITAPKINFETFPTISFSAWVNTANFIILFEHDAELHCVRGAADCGRIAVVPNQYG